MWMLYKDHSRGREICKVKPTLVFLMTIKCINYLTLVIGVEGD